MINSKHKYAVYFNKDKARFLAKKLFNMISEKGLDADAYIEPFKADITSCMAYPNGEMSIDVDLGVRSAASVILPKNKFDSDERLMKITVFLWSSDWTSVSNYDFNYDYDDFASEYMSPFGK